MAFDIKTAKIVSTDDKTKKFDISTAKTVEDTVGEKIQGTGRAIGNVATFGQASHLAGLGQGLGGAVYNLLHGENPFKDVESDYIEGREKYKQDQKKFKELNPTLNTLGEVTGAVATLPMGGAVGKIPAIAKLLKGAGAVKKGTLAGASWGASEGFGQGLSNTEGKGADIEKALTNATVGGVAGGLVGGALPLTFGGVKGGIKALANIPNKMKAGFKGDTIQYAVPNGVQTKTFRKLAENPVVQKEALRGDIGMRAEEFQNKATEKTLKFVPELFEKVSKDYNDLPKDLFISFDKMNTGSKLLKAIDNFGFDTKFMPNKAEEVKAKSLVQNILRSGKTVNNEYGITRENLQRAMNTTWENSQKAFNNGDNAVGKLYSDLYKVLREARATNQQVEKVSAKYHDIKEAKELLGKALGIKLEKGANIRQLATKLIQQSKNRSGNQFDDTLINVGEKLSKYADLPNVKELKNAIDLAQVSYDFRPPSESKLLNRIPTSQNSIFKSLFVDIPKKVLFETSPQEKAKLLAKNLREGKITADDVLGQFDIINAGKFSTGLNRFLQNQKVYGGRLNPIANLMRRKEQNTPLPTFLLTDGKRFSDIIRNPLILETNRRRELLKNIVRSK